VGRLSIAIWYGAPDSAVDWFRQEMRRGVERYGNRLAHMPVLLPSAPPFSEQTRKGLMKVVDDYDQQLDAITAVMTATGFRGAAIRAMGAGMIMLLPKTRVVIKICADHVDSSRVLLAAPLRDNQPALTGECIRSALDFMQSHWAETNRAPADQTA